MADEQNSGIEFGYELSKQHKQAFIDALNNDTEFRRKVKEIIFKD